ncbi:MAG: DUF2948 family protein [Alphaproteobacteria bacterium]|nr:DUF2948 family protein [Alphaproteobacteria bacterium]
MSGLLKLGAADAEDLEMLSARLQDAVGKLKDFVWLPKQRRFAVLVNRFRWEEAKGPGTRVRAVLRFDSVSKVQSVNIKQGAPDTVVSLLAIKFIPAAESDPAGIIELALAGGGTIRLTVECIDAELSDQTGPWAARAKPDHEDSR